MNPDNLLNIIISILVGLLAWWGGYRVFRGTGKKLRILFSLILAGLAFTFPHIGRVIGFIGLIAIGGLEIWTINNKKAYSYSQLTYEGGGIRRGLLPVEVGALCALTPSNLFVLGLIDSIQKGFVQWSNDEGNGLIVTLEGDFKASREILNPKSRRENRQEIAFQKKKLLTPSDDVLLEIFEQNDGKSLGEYSIQPWIEVLNRSVDSKLSGYDVVETQGYYNEFITHRLSGIESGYFDAQDYLGWIVLSQYLGDKNAPVAHHLLKKTRPSWLKKGEEFTIWLNLVSSVSW